jgi:hypothetical protein
MMALRVALAVLATSLLTWIFGWWAVAVVAFVSGLLPDRYAVRGGWMALAGGLSWGILLAWHAAHPAFGQLLMRLESVLGVPGPLVLVVALLFSALLGWSASVIGDAVVTAATRKRSPVDAAPTKATDYDSDQPASHVAMSESTLR